MQNRRLIFLINNFTTIEVDRCKKITVGKTLANGVALQMDQTACANQYDFWRIRHCAQETPMDCPFR